MTNNNLGVFPIIIIFIILFLIHMFIYLQT